jgi:hypothetical protein
MKLSLILILVGSALPALAADPDPLAPRPLTLDVELPKVKVAPMLGSNPFEPAASPAAEVAGSGILVPFPVGTVRFEYRPVPAGIRSFLDAPGPGYRAQKETPFGK